jgi:spermidine/putrescine transport system substrate-binding protein
MAQLEIRNVTRRFGDFVALNNVSLNIEAGEFFTLIGSDNSNRDALQYIHPEIAQNPAVFPDRTQQARLEMLRDLDRHQRRVLSRIWTEIKLR